MEIPSQSAITAQAVSVQGNSAAAVRTVASPVAQPDRQALEKAVKAMSDAINVTQPPQLSFAIDDSNEQVVIRITDANTGELIRQLPSADAISIANSLEKLQGLLFKGQA